METLAAIATGADAPFEIGTVNIEEPRDDEILVRITAVGVCHTDLVMKGFWPAGVPIVFGHEGAGIVERVGSAIEGVKAGDSVLLSFASCGDCRQCIKGQLGYCEKFHLLNSSGSREDGSSALSRGGQPVGSSFFGQSSFANYAITRRENTVVVDPSTDLVNAAPFGCGFQTGAGVVVNVFEAKPNSSLVVYGVGGVGMAAVMAAAALGVNTIVAVDLSDARRDVAKTVGATHTVDGAATDVSEQIREATNGGADFALDTTGAAGVIKNAVKALGPKGTLVLVGLGSPEITLDVNDLMGGGKSVRGCIEGDSDPQQMVPLMIKWHQEGKFPVEKLIRTYPFAEINQAVADTLSGETIKPVLTL